MNKTEPFILCSDEVREIHELNVVLFGVVSHLYVIFTIRYNTKSLKRYTDIHLTMLCSCEIALLTHLYTVYEVQLIVNI